VRTLLGNKAKPPAKKTAVDALKGEKVTSEYENYLQDFYTNTAKAVKEVIPQDQFNELISSLIKDAYNDFSGYKVPSGKDKYWYIKPTILGTNEKSEWRYIVQRGNILYATFYLFKTDRVTMNGTRDIVLAFHEKLKNVPEFKNGWKIETGFAYDA